MVEIKIFPSYLCFAAPQGRLLWQWRPSTKTTPRRRMGCCVTRFCLRTPRVLPPTCSPSTIKREESSQWRQGWTERCVHIPLLFTSPFPCSHFFLVCVHKKNALNVKQSCSDIQQSAASYCGGLFVFCSCVLLTWKAKFVIYIYRNRPGFMSSAGCQGTAWVYLLISRPSEN